MQAVGPAPVLTHHSSKQEPLNFSRFGDVLNKVNFILSLPGCLKNFSCSDFVASCLNSLDDLVFLALKVSPQLFVSDSVSLV